MKIVCISDTHNQHNDLAVPDGDMLIHAGDFSARGTAAELEAFNGWLGTLPHAVKIVVPGNHDLLCEDSPMMGKLLLSNADHVLLHEECVVEGLRIFGSPWTPWFHDWAFNYREKDAVRTWEVLPAGIDILVTHGPPRGILDKVKRPPSPNVGCPELLRVVQALRPKLHVFGHIHEQHGAVQLDGVTYVNAAMLDERYKPGPKATVFHI